MSNLIFKERACLSIEEITAYLNNSCTASIAHEIEMHLIDCQLCTSALEGLSDNNAKVPILNLKKDNSTYNTTSTTSSKHPVTEKKSNAFKWINRVAALALLCISIYAVQQYFAYKTDQKNLGEIASNLEHIESNTRSESNELPEAYLNAINTIETGDINLGIQELEQLYSQTPENPLLSYQLGLAYAKNKQHNKAIAHFTIVRINDENRYEQASWQLVLTHLNQNNKEAAFLILTDLIKRKDGIFYEDAIQLYTEIKKKL